MVWDPQLSAAVARCCCGPGRARFRPSDRVHEGWRAARACVFLRLASASPGLCGLALAVGPLCRLGWFLARHARPAASWPGAGAATVSRPADDISRKRRRLVAAGRVMLAQELRDSCRAFAFRAARAATCGIPRRRWRIFATPICPGRYWSGHAPLQAPTPQETRLSAQNPGSPSTPQVPRLSRSVLSSKPAECERRLAGFR